jgi:hypothetical protein
MTQERLSRFVFSSIFVAITAYWVWILFSHADQIFQAPAPTTKPGYLRRRSKSS